MADLRPHFGPTQFKIDQYFEVVESKVVALHFPSLMRATDPAIEVTLVWDRSQPAPYNASILVKSRIHNQWLSRAITDNVLQLSQTFRRDMVNVCLAAGFEEHKEHRYTDVVGSAAVLVRFVKSFVDNVQHDVCQARRAALTANGRCEHLIHVHPGVFLL